VAGVLNGFNGDTICRRRLLKQGYIRDMVHNNIFVQNIFGFKPLKKLGGGGGWLYF